MRSYKIIFLSVLIFFLNFIANSEELKEDCSKIESIYKKMVCKTNKATSSITNKKSLADFLPEDILQKKK